MVTVVELGRAPGKSMVAEPNVDALEINALGLFGDRQYMWVEAAKHINVNYRPGSVALPGQFLSLREDPQLTDIIPTLGPNGVTMYSRSQRDSYPITRREDVAEHRIPVSVWGWHGKAVDQGDEAATWGEQMLGRPVRLVELSNEEPRYVEDTEALGRVGFSDGYPLTVASTASLDLINRELAVADQLPIPLRRARANILLSGLVLPNRDSLPADVFPEDYIESIRVDTNGLVAVLRRLVACERCPIPDINHNTGERKGRPVLRALGRLGRQGTHLDELRYGAKPEIFWTQNFVIELPQDMPPDGIIRIERGSQVEVIYSDKPNWVPLGEAA